jgi:hypothetical protein
LITGVRRFAALTRGTNFRFGEARYCACVNRKLKSLFWLRSLVVALK